MTATADGLEAPARRMVETLTHRGPDGVGVWTDAAVGVALAHRRLAVLDLSPEGRQPMVSADGRFVIAYNGEIYNHAELRAAQDSHAWRGHSDTEVLLEIISRYGISRALEQTVGMFAFALWDRATGSLTLARDRLGEKPLYYGWQGNVFVFGSELKALRAFPGFKGEIDRDALMLFLRYAYVPEPRSIYQGISKLEPGTFLTVSRSERTPVPMHYWSAREVAEHGRGRPFAGSEIEALAELDTRLRRSIAGQMVADVPLGAFLSGGIDSSLVVALMQAQSTRPVKTFTIGFGEQGYNEAEHAKRVAQHLGTDHTELYVAPADALRVIPNLPQLYDEPFADASQIPTCLVSQLARQHVTVSLSGDGGDELFGGYNRYIWVQNLWRVLGRMPRRLRVAAAGTITSIPPSALDRMFCFLRPLLPASWRYTEAGDKLHKLAEVLDVAGPEEIYWRLVSQWNRPGDLVRGGVEPPTVLTDRGRIPEVADIEHYMMYLDSVSYLPGDILVKVDRAAMGVGLETRAPFLDHRLLEFAWTLPLSLKIRDGRGKWLVRRLLSEYIPSSLIERPKSGFAIPIHAWLRKPLREWAEHLLDPLRLRDQGYLNPAPIRQKWEEHLSGRRNWQYQLWCVLSFQAWLEAWH